VFPMPRNPFEALQVEFKTLEFRVLRDSGEAVSEVRAIGSKLESELVDLRGKSGNNGKIGTLRADIANAHASYATIRNGLIAVALALLGAVGVAAKALYTAGEASGTERAADERLRETVDDLTERHEQFRSELLCLRFPITCRHGATP
jgi:ribosomal protein L29